MALYLQVSNSLSQLAKQLYADLKSQQNMVFQPYYIVTQTEGMNNWLKLQLAGYMGIAANYRFMKPNDIIYEIYRLLGGKYSQSLSSDNLSWIFYKLLAEKDFIKTFSDVAAYYEEGADKEVKRLALAEKVADLFDQYQIYRPEMIQDWNLARAEDVKGDDWQKFLWIKARELTKDGLPDKTLIGQFILRALQQPEQAAELRARMPAVHIFGLSVITVYHLQLFSELGKYINFYFHILNPAPSVYWFEDRSEKQLALLKKKGFVDADEPVAGNPLLTSWGRLIQNTFSLFFRNEELINSYEEVGVEEPGDSTLLQCIQRDIFYNRSNAERKLLGEEYIADGSVTINACYTPAREVEALYNYLVHLVDKRKELLSARDIVVMVTDIDTYAPYIRAVFNNAPYQFQYTVADESFTAGDSITNALQSVLHMNRLNFKAEEVLQLLDSGYIRKRFGISNLSLIRKIVGKAGIRFGMDGDSEDDTIYVSWKYGIERIMYGLCMSGEGEFISPDGEGFYSLDVPEGHDSADIIKFCHFVQVLMDSVKERDTNRTISGWVEYIESVLYNLVFEPGEDADEDYDLLLKHLENYNGLNEFLTEELSYEVFIHSFMKALSASARSASFATGGITFCSLIPMRSIPFKVVALLGLNFDKFPRKENPSGFNLMEKEKRKGDRNIKENDKHLFLETVLSAQDYLYLSYIGQSVKDNTILPPSALVDELIDYIEAGSGGQEMDRNLLVTRQPLHGFSRKYQVANARLYTYLDDKQKNGGSELQLKPAKERGAFDFEEILLEGFIEFFRNPFKAYYNKILGIYYGSDDVLLKDTEVFDLDSLQRWKLKQDLLHTDPEEEPALKSRLIKTGVLPLKSMADVTVQSIEAEVAPVRKIFRECTDGLTEETVSVELETAEGLFKGRLNSIYGNKLICISWSKNEYRYLLEAYIRYLVARAAGVSTGLYFISAKKEQVFEATAMGTDEAYGKLTRLMQLYKQGHDNILAFYPDLGIDPVNLGKLNEEGFKKKVKDKVENYNIPCNDLYLIREYYKGFFNQDNIFDEYRENAELLLMPLIDFLPNYYSK